MSLAIIQGAVELGFIYSLIALALYISFRTLDIADLTTDGTFTLGCAVSASMAAQGRPILGLVAAVGAGMLAGLVTAVLQTRLKVQPILAGIVTMTGLYTINLAAMGGRSNLTLSKVDTVFTLAQGLFGQGFGKLILAALLALGAGVLVRVFLSTQLGLSLRATGDNIEMVRASSINPALTITVGLCLANGMTGLSGALLAQYQKFSDISLGTGMVTVGLASLIIGEVLVGAHRGRAGVGRGLLAVFVGGVAYRLIIALALQANFAASSLKLVSACIVAVAIGWPALVDAVRLAAKKAGYRRTKGKGDADHA